MTKYRAAVIGLGRMGSTFDDEVQRGGSVFTPYCHGPAYFNSPLTDLVAGSDLHDGQRESFGERWELSETQLYDDYNEMLEKEKPEIVSVCTSTRYRSKIVKDVARAGVKAIWAEKPMALSLAEADDMVAVCREEGVALAVNCARRYLPVFTEARQIIDNGELGNILQVTAYAQCPLSANGSHMLDTVRFLAGGEVQWVFGEMESDEAAVSDDDIMGNGYLAFDNGVRAYVRGMETGAAVWDFDVIGETGRIRITTNALQAELTLMQPTALNSRSTRPISSRGVEGSSLPAVYPYPWPMRIQGSGLTVIEDLTTAIESGNAPACSGEDGRAALETAIAMRESHRSGGIKVHLPIKDRNLKILSSEIQGDEVPRRFRGFRKR